MNQKQLKYHHGHIVASPCRGVSFLINCLDLLSPLMDHSSSTLYHLQNAKALSSYYVLLNLFCWSNLTELTQVLFPEKLWYSCNDEPLSLYKPWYGQADQAVKTEPESLRVECRPDRGHCVDCKHTYCLPAQHKRRQMDHLHAHTLTRTEPLQYLMLIPSGRKLSTYLASKHAHTQTH